MPDAHTFESVLVLLPLAPGGPHNFAIRTRKSLGTPNSFFAYPDPEIDCLFVRIWSAKNRSRALG